MTTGSRTFSESWHRVAELRVGLRHAVPIRKQLFRGETWYVLQDPFNNHFFRLRPEAHEFIVRLTAGRTVGQVWEACLARNPSGAPGQDDVIQLLAQLYHANLLVCDLPADSGKLFERYRQRKQRETRSKLLSLMFLRIPLFDPEPLLRHCLPLVRLLTGRFALLVWLLTLGWAGKTVFEQFPAVVGEAKMLLAFDNLALLYLGLVLIKTLHEFGHTLVCKRFGGEVHTMGIMLIIFAPVPYMDATSSWGFRNRRQRILVAAAGMFYEFFAAACAALVWAGSGPGALHSLAFNMMMVASISTLLFNANPLLRYDGYYILSDLLDIPNLQPRSLAQLRHLIEYYLFGDRQSTSPADSRKEASWLTMYGILSGLYRVIVYGGIILFVADRFLLAGLLMAVVCIFSWGVVPAVRFVNYISASPKLAKTRTRAIAVSLTAVGVILFVIGAIPFQNSFRAPGILEAKNYLQVANDTSGRLTKILAHNGSRVNPGAPLIQLVDPEIDIEIGLVKAQRKEVVALLHQSAVLDQDRAREVLNKRLLTLDDKLRKTEKQRQALLVRAEQAGIWVAPDIHELQGVWLPRGTALGKIISPEHFRFSAVVSQEEAAHLFSGSISGPIAVRLIGQGNTDLLVTGYKVIPFQHERLPSAALGWHAGGEIPVSGKDAQGLQTIEPFFRIYADLEPSRQVVLNHGHSGQIRFSLQAGPLLGQLLRKVRQFFQKRYQT
jgi:putative peptide zinc metalloprotease protein